MAALEAVSAAVCAAKGVDFLLPRKPSPPAEAVEHISEYGSGHSEAIVTENPDAAAFFQREVDAACVYVNAPTSFTDGARC